MNADPNTALPARVVAPPVDAGTLKMQRQRARELLAAAVRDPAHGYLSVSFPESDGLEITCRI